MNAVSPEHHLPRSAAAVVVGGGFAGLSTANALWRRGVTDIVVLEQEAIPAFHSSGRNAAILRRLIEEPTTLALGRAGHAALSALREEDGSPLVKRTGGLLIGDAPFLDRMATLSASAPELGAVRMSRDEVLAKVPTLAGATFAGGLHVGSDGVVDIHGLIRAFLAPMRERFFPNTPVIGVGVEGGRVTSVTTERGTIATARLVIAGGFGSNHVARLAGLTPLPFLPVRRHLFVTAPTDLVPRDTPWVWNGSAGYYFRPEGAGLLLCACDATPWRDDQPFDPPVDPNAREALADKLMAEVPRLAEVRPTRGWAGLRVLTPDDRFVIGPDPRLDGLTWVAGLGGHGMTTACAVGELGADLVLGEASSGLVHLAAALSPARFLGSGA
jgi:glycine/D-amino acid oxidase-like deaminating enzyme